MTYCVVADLQQYFSPIDNYDGKVTLPDFEFTDLTGDKFELGDAGSCIVMYKNGVDLGAAEASVGAVDASGKWYYDSALDKLTIQLGSGETPSDADIRLERAPLDWADAKTKAVQIGTNKVDQNLDRRFPRPLPKIDDNATGDSYDQAVIELNALYACLHLMQSTGAPESEWMEVKNRITNENENGILDLINKGEITLSFELTKSDEGQLKEIAVNASTTGYPTDAVGTPSVTYDVYLITIGTGGTFTTGTDNTTITYSTTNLKGETSQGEQLIDGGFQAIGGGMSARFVSSTDGLVYTAGDKWSLTVQTEGVESSRIGMMRVEVR